MVIALIIISIIAVVESIYIIYVLIKESSEKVSEEELISMVNESHEQGVLLTQEAAMIQNVFEFDEKDAKDIMVHRKNIVAIDSSMTLTEALAFINEHHFSRYPVYKDDLEHIIGIIHIKDILEYVDNPIVMAKPLNEINKLVQKTDFIPETHSINNLLAKMQSKKTHMVIVVDEYGQVSGLIAMEDIIEEIVGNILDEHDEADDFVSKVADNVFIMEGSTPLSEVSDALNIEFPEEFETLNGFLTAKIGRIPQDDQTYRIEDQGYSFYVKEVKHKVCQNVVVRLLPKPQNKSTSIE